MVPRIVGFMNDAELEFFELFCSVDGVGVKKALRAMVRPVREIAVSIEEQDAKGLLRCRESGRLWLNELLPSCAAA
jgi:Holliday junction DNA helicase RuvA